MEEVIKLPFVKDETLRCYLCNAFWGGVLSSYVNMEGWIIEHYVQMFYVSNRKVLHSDYLESQINYYGGWTEPMSLFDRHLYNINSIDEGKIVKWIKGKICEGYYCYTYINESFLGKGYDNAHDVIVIGFDEKKRVFNTVGYFNKAYCIKEVSYDIFENNRLIQDCLIKVKTKII